MNSRFQRIDLDRDSKRPRRPAIHPVVSGSRRRWPKLIRRKYTESATSRLPRSFDAQGRGGRHPFRARQQTMLSFRNDSDRSVSSDKTRNVYAREREREKKRERRKFYLTLGRGKIRCRFEGSKQSSRRSLLVTSHNVRCTPTWDIVRITRSFLLKYYWICAVRRRVFFSYSGNLREIN